MWPLSLDSCCDSRLEHKLRGALGIVEKQFLRLLVGLIVLSLIVVGVQVHCRQGVHSNENLVRNTV